MNSNIPLRYRFAALLLLCVLPFALVIGNGVSIAPVGTDPTFNSVTASGMITAGANQGLTVGGTVYGQYGPLFRSDGGIYWSGTTNGGAPVASSLTQLSPGTLGTPGSFTVSGRITASGGIAQLGLAKTAAYSIAVTDPDIEADATGGAFTLTYHALSGNAGLVRNVTNVGTANSVTITLPSGAFVNGPGAGTASMTLGVGANATLKINSTGTKILVQ